MRILMICTDFPYNSKDGTIIQGGGSACIAQLVEGLLEKGHEIEVVTRSEHKITNELFDIPIHRTKFLYLGFRESKITHSLFSLPTAVRAVKRFNPNIIHSHNPPAAITGIACAKIFNKPHVITMHGPWSDVRISGLKKSAAEHIERLTLRKADSITCDSVALARQLHLKYNVATAGIQNAVDKGYFSSIPKNKARKMLGIRTRDRIVLFTGRFVAEKGLDTLLEAASIVLLKKKAVTFLLIGGGFDEQVVHHWLAHNRERKKKIITIQFLKHEMMKAAYNAADVFVLPSLAEGLSRSLMEAMLFGLPCIATAVGGNIELLENRRGFLVPAKDKKALAAGIEKLLDNRRLAKRLSDKAKKYVINNLTVEKRIERFIELYGRIMKKGKRRA